MRPRALVRAGNILDARHLVHHTLHPRIARHYTRQTPAGGVFISDLLASPEINDSRIRVDGFVRSIRKQKRIAFAVVSDGSSSEALQVVLDPELGRDVSNGTAVTLHGTVKASPNPAQQAIEFHADEVAVLGENDVASSPIQKKFQTPDHLRTIPHLRARLPFHALLLRLRSHVLATMSAYFNERGFVQTHTPVITSSDCEGAGEVFVVQPTPEQSITQPGTRLRTQSEDSESSGSPQRQIDVDAHQYNNEMYFGAPKYLTVSAQLHLEALAQSVGQVWTVSPTFRAEQSDTSRHLSEFYMVEAEMCFITQLDAVMDIVEGLVAHIAASLLTSSIGQELIHGDKRHTHGLGSTPERSTLNLVDRWTSLAAGNWPRISHQDAVTHLRAHVDAGKVSFEHRMSRRAALKAEHERYIVDTIGHGGPVFVTDYPRAAKPFYMAPSDPTHPRLESTPTKNAVPTVACFDLLLPDVLEVAGGSMREHRYQPLRAAMRARGFVGSDEGGVDPTDLLALLPDPDRGADDVDTPADERGDAGLLDAHTNDEAGGDDSAHSLDWYLDLRRYGGAPHGGFGLGLDRLLCYLAGEQNVRDVATFPRWYKRCTC